MKIENVYEITVLNDTGYFTSTETIVITRPTMAEALKAVDKYANEKYGALYDIKSIELIEEVK